MDARPARHGAGLAEIEPGLRSPFPSGRPRKPPAEEKAQEEEEARSEAPTAEQLPLAGV